MKGSGRRVNAASRPPSVRDLLARAPSIEALAELRRGIFAVHLAGGLDAKASTLREWEERLWVRVVELMRATPTDAMYIYNTTLRWGKPAGLAYALEYEVTTLLRALPNEAERLLAQGIIIEGVTG